MHRYLKLSKVDKIFSESNGFLFIYFCQSLVCFQVVLELDIRRGFWFLLFSNHVQHNKQRTLAKPLFYWICYEQKSTSSILCSVDWVYSLCHSEKHFRVIPKKVWSSRFPSIVTAVTIGQRKVLVEELTLDQTTMNSLKMK